MSPTARVMDDPMALAPYADAWDALAVAARRPYCSPLWMLPWWRHATSGRTALRVVLVQDGGELIGVAPLFAQLGPLGLAEYRLLGAGNSHRIEPLAALGREQEVARSVAVALAGADPRPSSLVLEGVNAASPWVELLARAWPGRRRPHVRCALVMPAPTLTLAGRTYEEWLAERGSRSRGRLNRNRRALERAGGHIRMTSAPQQLEHDLAALWRLHRATWEERGGSRALTPGVVAMVQDAAPQLLANDRLRLWLVELDGEPVAASMFVTGGGELCSWMTGFDRQHAKLRASQPLTLAVIEDAFGRGDARLDYGGGAGNYKESFASQDEPIAWTTLTFRHGRYPLTRAQRLPKDARYALRTAYRGLTPERRQQVDRLFGRRAAE